MNKPDLARLLTIYGRKPVLEALQDTDLQLFRLHLADSNRQEGILLEIQQLARQRHVDVQLHGKKELSRISKNSQQDQGVALDIHVPQFRQLHEYLQQQNDLFQLIAVDGVTNPQNLGMIIRSVCASPMTGLLLPVKGCARLDALVIKASAGSLFKCPIIRCDDLAEALQLLLQRNCELFLLDANGKHNLFDLKVSRSAIYVLGNETEGVSKKIRSLPHNTLAIPMQNGVESLNVAVTAALVAFIAGHNSTPPIN